MSWLSTVFSKALCILEEDHTKTCAELTTHQHLICPSQPHQTQILPIHSPTSGDKIGNKYLLYLIPYLFAFRNWVSVMEFLFLKDYELKLPPVSFCAGSFKLRGIRELRLWCVLLFIFLRGLFEVGIFPRHCRRSLREVGAGESVCTIAFFSRKRCRHNAVPKLFINLRSFLGHRDKGWKRQIEPAWGGINPIHWKRRRFRGYVWLSWGHDGGGTYGTDCSLHSQLCFHRSCQKADDQMIASPVSISISHSWLLMCSLIQSNRESWGIASRARLSGFMINWSSHFWKGVIWVGGDCARFQVRPHTDKVFCQGWRYLCNQSNETQTSLILINEIRHKS